MKEPTRFITNEKGERLAVIIDVEEYERLIEELEELDDIRAFDEAEASGEEGVPFEEVIEGIERKRDGE